MQLATAAIQLPDIIDRPVDENGPLLLNVQSMKRIDMEQSFVITIVIISFLKLEKSIYIYIFTFHLYLRLV